MSAFQEAMQEAPLRLTKCGYASPEDINDGGCFEWATEVFSLVFGSKIVNKDYAGGYHCFIEYRGRFYDSETLGGTKRWQSLPYFKRCKESV